MSGTLDRQSTAIEVGPLIRKQSVAPSERVDFDNPPKSEQVKGIIAILVGGLIFSASSALVHFSARIPPMQHLVFRSIFGIIVVGASLLWQGKPLLGQGKAMPWIHFRGLITGPALCVYFFAFEWLPPANAVTIYSATGVVICWVHKGREGFTLVINHIFLGELLTWIHIPCVALSVLGATLIAQPTFLVGDLAETDAGGWEYLFAIGGALFMSTQALPTRVVCRYGRFNEEMLFSLSVIGLLSGLGVMLFDAKRSWVLPPYDIMEWVSIAAISIGGLVIQATCNYAMERLEGGVVGLVVPCEVIWAFMWQICVFHHPTNFMAISGACVVISSIILISLEKMLDLSGSLQQQQQQQQQQCKEQDKNFLSSSLLSTVSSSADPVADLARSRHSSGDSMDVQQRDGGRKSSSGSTSPKRGRNKFQDRCQYRSFSFVSSSVSESSVSEPSVAEHS